jgi:hypothetical protein
VSDLLGYQDFKNIRAVDGERGVVVVVEGIMAVG